METIEENNQKLAYPFIFLACCFFYFQIILFKKEWIFLDNLNLAFHEAGHLLFPWAPEVVQYLGGSFGQIAIPLVVAAVFLFRKEAFAASLMFFWTSENLVNIARYIEDAQDMVLPLVGGGIHDWHWILIYHNKLTQYHTYSQAARNAGITGMTISLLVALAFLLRIYFRPKSEA